jgi:hypothetical protein
MTKKVKKSVVKAKKEAPVVEKKEVKETARARKIREANNPPRKRATR